jgi:hypothetical protein
VREEWQRPHAVKMRAAAERRGRTMVLVEPGPADFASARVRMVTAEKSGGSRLRAGYRGRADLPSWSSMAALCPTVPTTTISHAA